MEDEIIEKAVARQKAQLDSLIQRIGREIAAGRGRYCLRHYERLLFSEVVRKYQKFCLSSYGPNRQLTYLSGVHKQICKIIRKANGKKPKNQPEQSTASEKPPVRASVIRRRDGSPDKRVLVSKKTSPSDQNQNDELLIYIRSFGLFKNS